MASLADRLKKNPLVRGAGGQLSEESGEEIQQLSGQAGLAAPPTTAIGQGMIGASPDQQKMAGTAAQKTAALNLASQQPQGAGLQDALRRQQVRTEATEGEQGSQKKSEDMKNLGSLGDRVTDFINVQKQKLESEAGKGVHVSGTDEFQGRNIANEGELKNMLQSYREHPEDQNLLLKLNQALGYDLNRQLSPQEVDQLYETSVSAISKGAAGNVDDDLNVDDLIKDPNFGYDKNILADMLGVSREQIGKFSVGQLKDAVAKVQADEFNKTANLEQKATSGQLGQAERGLARGAAMEASRVGTRSSEADVQHLENQIASADTVTFAGKQMKVDDMLKDDNISNVIAEYMNSAPGSDIRNSIDKGEPELRDFIQKNQAVLEDASKHMQAGAQTFQQTQEYNKKLQYEPFGGMKLDDDLAKTLIPGFGSLQVSRVDVNQVPVLKLAMEKGPEYGKTMATNINQEYKNDPQTANDINGLDYETAKSWDIGGGGDSPWQTSYIQPKRFWEEVSRMPPGQTGPLLQKAFTNITDGGQAQDKLSGNRSSNVLGFPSSINAGVIDQNGDGILDSADEIKNALLKANPRPNLKSGPAAQQVYKAGELKDPQIPTSGTDKAIYDKLNGAAQKGSINYEDLTKAGLSLDEAIALQDRKGQGNIDYDGVNKVQGELRDGNTNNGIGDAMKESNRDSQVNKLNALMNQDDRHINKDLVRGKLAELGALSAADKASADEADRARTGRRVSQQNELKTVLSGGVWAGLPPETQEALNKMGTELGEGQLKQLKDTATWDKNATVGQNVAILARNIATLPGRQAQDAAKLLQKNIMNGTISDTIGGAAKSYGNQIADVAKNPGGAISDAGAKIGLGGGGDGCFVAGTKFILSDGSVKDVDKLTPHDKLLQGGRTIATAQFICDEIYFYKGAFVSGSHAVLEDDRWIKVRNSAHAERDEGLDGSIVYVVWNTGHRMVHETGTVFADYAETDSTVTEIEEQRNLSVLNSSASL